MSADDQLSPGGPARPEVADGFLTDATLSAEDLGRLVEQAGACGGDGQLSCDEAAGLIMIYLDSLSEQSAADATAARMRDHLGSCSPCETEFAVYQRISVSLSRCRPALPPETKQRLERFCNDLCNGDDDRA